MSVQVYSVSGQTEGRKKSFLEWINMNLSFKLSLTCGGNVNYYKNIHHLIPTLTVVIGITLTIFKANQSNLLSTESPGIFSYWPNWRGEEDLFWRVQEGWPLCEVTLRALGCHKRWKSLFFCGVLNNPTSPLLLVRPRYK